MRLVSGAISAVARIADAQSAIELCRRAKDREVTETSVVKLRGDEISVSVKQAARLIGLPLRTLQAETKAGRIPAARRIGRRYVYLIDELKRMVESAVRPGMS
jgi:excisionase family DNA binding protein